MPTVAERLARLSAAEDFFALLEVPYDPAVLRVKRLHILKRFQHYLQQDDGTAADEAESLARHRAALETAYQDFVVSDALTERVFKVLQDAVAPPAADYVPLNGIGRFR